MGSLADNIRKAIAAERYVFGAHADQRLRDRRIMGWQVVSGMDDARLIAENADGSPFPTANFEQELADGTPINVVWAWISADQTAKLVTVFFTDK
jgi:hypothetical protein